MKKLEKLRKELDYLDTEIFEKISMRFTLIEEIAEYKKNHGMKIKDTNRENEIKARIKQLAKDLIFDPNIFEKIYEIIFEESCKFQEKIIGEKNGQ